MLGPPNGSRLSCGANAGRRKHPALRYEVVGAQTHASSESRPRQLQALVRLQARSEEHTSELQSHSDLVCRLLLEKKKKNKQNSHDPLNRTHDTEEHKPEQR